MDEQLFWARRLHRLQLAGKPLPAKHVKAVDLANSLRTLLETDRFRLKAQQASIAMKNQAGAHQAVQLIERYISSSKKFNPT
jgi:UDP:flavonoid glycosyltransferase YjiC (YdhE family)